MKTYKETRIIDKPRLVIVHDDSESPREWTNLGYFITQDNDCESPDKNDPLQYVIKETGDVATDLENHIKLIKEQYEEATNEKVIKIYPVVKYEHSRVVYSLGASYGFDYSNNGFYIITKESQKEQGTEPRHFEEVIKQEIDLYNKYINGDVYRFTLYDKEGEDLDSCGGFYDIEDIREHLPKEWKNEGLEEYIIY